MYRSIVISPDAELSQELMLALEASGRIEIVRTLDHYPTEVELIRSVRALAAAILFVNFQSLKKGLEIVQILESGGSRCRLWASTGNWTRRCFAQPCGLESANS